jgi:hypothetical protein
MSACGDAVSLSTLGRLHCGSIVWTKLHMLVLGRSHGRLGGPELVEQLRGRGLANVRVRVGEPRIHATCQGRNISLLTQASSISRSKAD